MTAALGSNVARGVTLVEVCIVLAILAVLAGSALPSFKETLQKRKFDGAVAEITTEVNFARGTAVAQGRGTWLNYTRVAGGSCALIHVGAKTDCTCAADGQPVCAPGAEALKATLHAVPVSVAPQGQHHGPGTLVLADGGGERLRDLLTRPTTEGPGRQTASVRPPTVPSSSRSEPVARE
jgi:prepilin-type N-terminal cleavage/methylation domain-containing protein